jgi:predicted dehydrogenase
LRIDVMSNRPNQNFYFALQGTRGAIESPRGPLGQQDMYKAYTCDGGVRVSRGILWEDFWSYSHLLPENYRNMPAGAQKLAANGDYNACGGDYYVVQDFVRALRGEIESPVDVYEACEWSAVALLSEISAENGGRPVQMPDFRGGREAMALRLNI